MFKRLILICIFVLGIGTFVQAADNVTATVTAQNSFTSSFSPTFKGRSGYLKITISGTWVATVTLQNSTDNAVTWVDASSWTANTIKALTDKDVGLWRIGVKTGDFTSGSVVLRLARERGTN